jgi:N-acetyl-anhydromuramyl-L-alanine amidase AmpD
VQLITDGFSPTDANGWCADYATKRTLEAVVWHDMEGYLAGAIARWNSGAAGAHLCVLKNGQIVLTCRLQDVAWHAGTDNRPGSETYGRDIFWRSHNINPHSIGVEIEGFADARDGGYTAAQIAAIGKIADWATRKLGIRREHTFDAIPGHHAHSEISAMRGDPGPNFDWSWVLD